MRDDPQRAGELTGSARALLTRPWRTAEADRPLFLLIRRHAEQLDRWFTQRLGYRLIVGTDTVVTARTTPLCAVPSIVFGSMPNDGGHLLLTQPEQQHLLSPEPKAKNFIRPPPAPEALINDLPPPCLLPC